MTISMDKRYRTRDGRDVRLLCIDAPGTYPIVGYVLNDDFGCEVHRWGGGGEWQGFLPNDPNLDLIEVQSAEDVARSALFSLSNQPNKLEWAYMGDFVVAALRDAGKLKEDS